ncbi:hypothetical protein B0T14DRAFT_602273 [Immersiella caudata]|uniref:Uncharacterized protein n=1 Tax=Immersiella caudata TaxID=314043 RepID=A0AA40C3A1_9PEZI|nr:hypothetical protein B0T14DRAFT_602273 [Immersiella caudata]
MALLPTTYLGVSQIHGIRLHDCPVKRPFGDWVDEEALQAKVVGFLNLLVVSDIDESDRREQFLAITRLTWFQRGWTFQALITAPKITLLYKRAVLPWYDLLRQLPAAYREAGVSAAAGRAETAYLWMEVEGPLKVRPSPTATNPENNSNVTMISMGSFYAHPDSIMTRDRVLMLATGVLMFSTSLSSALVVALVTASANTYVFGRYEPWEV